MVPSLHVCCLAGLNDSSYDTEKHPWRVNKRRRPVLDLPKECVFTFSIREVMLCIDFLECCYNPLMKVVKVRGLLDSRSRQGHLVWCLPAAGEYHEAASHGE